jgi:hypothetical protein
MTKSRIALALGFVLSLTSLTAMAQNTTFSMVRSTGAQNAGCIPNAKGRVTINSVGNAENLHVEVSDLPPNTDFDVFVIQLPNAPFGLSWYQGDLKTDSLGKGVADFAGRFSIETFIVAPGSGPSPVVFNNPPFPDASSNPATGPVHTYHLGVWFDSPTAAGAAGCGSGPTPFNGQHNAGLQALSTRNFANATGPLMQIP